MDIGIIGIGNIGSILLERFLRLKSELKLYIFNRTPQKMDPYRKIDNIICCNGSAEVSEKAEIIFFAVKPQDVSTLFEQVKNVDFTSKVVVSTMAGISMKVLEEELGTKKVVRIMPNIPGMIGKGVTGISYSPNISKEERHSIISLLESIGNVVEVKERDFAAVTALSGSGPAFIFVIVEALIDIGLKMGLSYDKARELILDTVIGSVELLKEKGNHPGEFRHLVTSPSGTTIEGIYSLEREGLRGTIMKTILDTYIKAGKINEEIEKKL
ncbi:pyrroline-5-carboxylate reductase [Kosmotoga arenicorallina S304]|uniref:Pyrroline-5-carboxylate reductase n=1 Tax=Kosmotoga arenicorallina S304 TaxID=1453497 RepID=A0A182C861_9BACT|nr:pyrroline-5-carboxylate reductase [Kosmotoga arenicorallina]OAA32518.1 pyrroline-5-carboxylate reductase [Kosmotoga arenicorallina S304]